MTNNPTFKVVEFIYGLFPRNALKEVYNNYFAVP